MHEELVVKRHWVSDRQFWMALNYCMLLPGPEAQQLSIYIGWLLHGLRGGIVAGVFFVLPSVFILLLLSWLYVSFGNLPWMVALFAGLKPAVVAIVAHAVIRMGGRVLHSIALWNVAVFSFISLFVFHVPYPVIILGTAICGWIGVRHFPKQFVIEKTNLKFQFDPKAVLPPSELGSPKLRHYSMRVLGIGLLVWWIPVGLIAMSLGKEHSVVHEALFFSKAALITFGGAYAVLPYVSQQAVENFQWLSTHQMMDGLGFAETTPGPLIMVLQFVGFLGAYSQPGGLNPLLSGLVGALITTWTTFIPSFIFIFLGAPWIERLQHRVTLNAALVAVTAAVVGMILYLALWFGWTVFYSTTHGANIPSIALSCSIYFALTRLKWNLIKVLAWVAFLSWVAFVCGWHL